MNIKIQQRHCVLRNRDVARGGVRGHGPLRRGKIKGKKSKIKFCPIQVLEFVPTPTPPNNLLTQQMLSYICFKSTVACLQHTNTSTNVAGLLKNIICHIH